MSIQPCDGTEEIKEFPRFNASHKSVKDKKVNMGALQSSSGHLEIDHSQLLRLGLRRLQDLFENPDTTRTVRWVVEGESITLHLSSAMGYSSEARAIRWPTLNKRQFELANGTYLLTNQSNKPVALVRVERVSLSSPELPVTPTPHEVPSPEVEVDFKPAVRARIAAEQDVLRAVALLEEAQACLSKREGRLTDFPGCLLLPLAHLRGLLGRKPLPSGQEREPPRSFEAFDHWWHPTHDLLSGLVLLGVIVEETGKTLPVCLEVIHDKLRDRLSVMMGRAPSMVPMPSKK